MSAAKVLASVSQKPFFKEKDFVLYNSDLFDLISQLEDSSVDMIFADPPYNLSNDGFSIQSGKMVSVNKGDWDKSKGFELDYQFHFEWLKACRRVLKPHGTLWVSGTYHSIYQCGHAIQSLGYHILNDVTWFKPNAAPNLSCRMFTASHETLLWVRKEKNAKHIFNYDAMRNGDWPDDDVKKPNKQMVSVWRINTTKPYEKTFGKHPTQKPLELLERIILASTEPGAVILDPFTGSSTTGLAAVKHGRKFIGIDKVQEYLELSKLRYDEMFTKL